MVKLDKLDKLTKELAVLKDEEGIRTKAEKFRDIAEKVRVLSEEARELSEKARIKAEEARDMAEKLRVSGDVD